MILQVSNLAWAQAGGSSCLGWARLGLLVCLQPACTLAGAGRFMTAASGMAGMTEVSFHMAIMRFQEQQGRDPSMCRVAFKDYACVVIASIVQSKPQGQAQMTGDEKRIICGHFAICDTG